MHAVRQETVLTQHMIPLWALRALRAPRRSLWSFRCSCAGCYKGLLQKSDACAAKTSGQLVNAKETFPVPSSGYYPGSLQSAHTPLPLPITTVPPVALRISSMSFGSGYYARHFLLDPSDADIELRV